MATLCIGLVACTFGGTKNSNQEVKYHGISFQLPGDFEETKDPDADEHDVVFYQRYGFDGKVKEQLVASFYEKSRGYADEAFKGIQNAKGVKANKLSDVTVDNFNALRFQGSMDNSEVVFKLDGIILELGEDMVILHYMYLKESNFDNILKTIKGDENITKVN